MSMMEKNVHIEGDIDERSNEQMDYVFEVVNQKYCLLSIIDPEDVNKPCGVKIFGCYPSEESANAAAKIISSECDFFHVYVCPTSAWVPVPPSSKSIESVEYQESRMKDIQDTFKALKERKAKDVLRHLNKEATIQEMEQESAPVSVEEVEEEEDSTNHKKK